MEYLTELERVFHMIECPTCNTRWQVTANILRGFADWEIVVCEKCKTPTREIRADAGYEMKEV